MKNNKLLEERIKLIFFTCKIKISKENKKIVFLFYITRLFVPVAYITVLMSVNGFGFRFWGNNF